MQLLIKAHLLYSTAQPCDLLLQVEALSDAGQVCHDTQLVLSDDVSQRVIPAEADIGNRRWIKAGPTFECDYQTRVEVTRPGFDIESLPETPRMQTPGAVIPYLMPSRYCQSDLFLDFVASQFGDLTGGALICAMNTWIKDNFTYDAGASFVGTSATDSFGSLSGVCRDYAHVLISFARAAGIPARFVSAYAPDVVPQDFHAVVEVFLDGDWHIVDPTGMAKSPEVARICIGRDAADASFMTSYGRMDLIEQSVEVTRAA